MTNETLTLGQIASDAYNALDYIRPNEPGHDDYAEAISRINNDFSEGLRAHYAPDFTLAQGLLIYSQAYQAGHSNGYTEVESEYQDITEFIRSFNAAA